MAALKKVERWKGPDLVWVRWLDAAFDSDHDGENDRVREVDTFGVLVDETREFIKIAQSTYPPDHFYEDAAERITIPRKMIQFTRVVRSFK